MAKTEQKNDFRGLTIFELLAIVSVIAVVILWSFSVKTNLSNQRIDAERRARVSTFKEHLKSYVVTNGSFPSEKQFQDENTRNDIFKSFLIDEGSDALSDPKNKKELVSYVVEPEGCSPETTNLCTKVTLSLTLSNGDDYIKFAVKPGEELRYLQQAVLSGDSQSQEVLRSNQADNSDQSLGD